MVYAAGISRGLMNTTVPGVGRPWGSYRAASLARRTVDNDRTGTGTCSGPMFGIMALQQSRNAPAACRHPAAKQASRSPGRPRSRLRLNSTTCIMVGQRNLSPIKIVTVCRHEGVAPFRQASRSVAEDAHADRPLTRAAIPFGGKAQSIARPVATRPADATKSRC